MSIADQDVAQFLAVATMEAALTDATGGTSIDAARLLHGRGWTPDDIHTLAWLANHAILTGTPMGEEDEDSDGDPVTRLRILTGQCLNLLDFYDRQFGETIAFEWMGVIMSAPIHALEEIADQVDRTGGTTVYHETTALLGYLGPLAWAAGLTLDEALSLVPTDSTWEILTLRAIDRGFTLPPRLYT